MDKERRLIIAGNWTMNKTVSDAVDLVDFDNLLTGKESA